METAELVTTPAVPEIVEIPDLSVKGRCGPLWLCRIKAIIGLPAQRRLARAALYVDRIRYWEKEFSRLSKNDLRLKGMQLRGRAHGGESLNRLLPEAFGLVCVAASRTIQLRPFDVQLAAGVVLHEGALAELATGEGKTLVAAMPTYLNALTGKGVHVTTVNDYLAKRDAEWIGPIYQALGLTIGALQQKMLEQERHAAYRCDITYGTAAEFGFDFLRDRLKLAGGASQAIPFWNPWTNTGLLSAPLDPRVQRDHHYALVDEADNVFVDEAKTPLIVANPVRLAGTEESIVHIWADKLARQMVRDRDFTLDEKKQKLELSDAGRQMIRYSNPPVGPHSHAMDKLHEHVEQALHAHYRFRRDQHYMVGRLDKDYDEVIIIDEGTGRIQPDRHWTEGLHEAVQAKEGVPITKGAGAGGDHAAKITLQCYFRLYEKLAGMTGTAAQNWRELRRVYKLVVVCVPTNRPVIREVWPDRIFPTEDAKFDAVVEEIVRLHTQGRPILVGTRTVGKSEKLSERLKALGIEHEVLNAKPKHLEREASDRGPGRPTRPGDNRHKHGRPRYRHQTGAWCC